jgi:alkylation response protein AidB-like acyl-CoA dehydrogenase
MRAYYDEEELMLASVATDLAGSLAITSPREIDEGRSAEAWKQLTDTGLLGLRLRSGGEGPEGSGVAVQIIAAALGKALAPVPFLESAALVVEVLAQGAPESAAAVADGRSRWGLLLAPDLRNLAGVSDLAAGRAVGWGTAGAEYGLVLGSNREVHRAPLAAGDPVVRGDLDLTRTLLVPSVGGAPESLGFRLDDEAYDRWLALALVGLCADAQGALAGAIAVAVEWAKDRKAFGRPIGTFQALQHILADDQVSASTVETTTNYAAWAIDELPAAEALLAARTAKAYLGEVGRGVCEDVMQVFGGIGQTWEHVGHLYTRRVLLDSRLFGGRRDQLDAIAAARLD